MKYGNIKTGSFVDRPNRFVAHVYLDGQLETVHVKNTGRCRELLVPGAEVFLEKSDNPDRKTGYDLVGVKKGGILVNMDSQAPNKAVGEWLAQGSLTGATPDLLRPETVYGKSRFDFYMEAGDRKIFLEVKGVTLEAEGIARFPDAPTQRGIKHMEELISSVQEGYEGYIMFVIQMKGIRLFEPNDDTHPAFGETLRRAAKAGVKILAYDCMVTEDEMWIDTPIPVYLG